MHLSINQKSISIFIQLSERWSKIFKILKIYNYFYLSTELNLILFIAEPLEKLK